MKVNNCDYDCATENRQNWWRRIVSDRVDIVRNNMKFEEWMIERNNKRGNFGRTNNLRAI